MNIYGYTSERRGRTTGSEERSRLGQKILTRLRFKLGLEIPPRTLFLNKNFVDTGFTIRRASPYFMGNTFLLLSELQDSNIFMAVY